MRPIFIINFIIPFILASIQFGLQSRVMLKWNGVEWRQYLLCWFGSIWFWSACLSIIAFLFRKKKRWPLSLLFVFALALLIWAPLQIYQHYAMFPTLDGYLFFANQRKFFLESASSMFEVKDGLMLLAISIAIALIARLKYRYINFRSVHFWTSNIAGMLFFVTLVTVVSFRPSLPLTLDSNSFHFVAKLIQWGNHPPDFFRLRSRMPQTIELAKNAKHPKLNVLMIIGETLGASYLSPFGFDDDPMPNLSRILTKSNIIQLNKLHSNASCTDVSVPSILTGIDPTVEMSRLLGAWTPFDAFKAFGYQTFFGSSHNLQWAGLGDFIKDEAIDFYRAAEHVNPNASHAEGISDKLNFDWALEKMHTFSKNSNPFLGVIHMNTTHPPFQINENLDSQPFQDSTKNYLYKAEGFVRYLNSLHHLDNMFGAFFDEFEKTGLEKNTLIVFTADHGEGFRQHGILSHCGKYYKEESHIPGFILLPEDFLKKSSEKLENLRNNSHAFISNTDLFPTILDLVDAPHTAVDKQFTGHAISQKLDPERIYLFSNCSEFRNCPIPHFGIYYNGFKYMYHAQEKRWEVFDTQKDPFDLHDVSDQQKQNIAHLLQMPKIAHDPTLMKLL